MHLLSSTKRLLATLTILLIGILIPIGLGTNMIHNADKQINQFYKDPFLGIASIGQIASYSQRSNGIVASLVEMNSSEQIDKYIAELKDIQDKNDREYADYEKSVHEPEDRKLFEDLKIIRYEFRKFKWHIVDLIKEGKHIEAHEYYVKNESISIKYSQQCEKLHKYNEERGHKLYDESVRSIKISIALFLILSMIIFFVSAIVNYFIYITVKRLQETKTLLQISRDDAVQLSLSLQETARDLEETNEELVESKLSLQNLLKEEEELVRQETAKRVDGERLLLQQSRYMLIGELLSNIAHHWRQPLNSIGMNIQDVPLAFQNGEVDEAYLDNFRSTSMQILTNLSKTIDNFRNFFKPNSQKEKFFIAESVKQAVDMLSDSFSINNIQITFNIFDTDISIFGHSNEFSQVIMSLLNNSKDALCIARDYDRKVVIDMFSVGDKIKITISDNAGGIPNDIINKVFDPYFTTKHKAQGVGLGLYMCKMIIEQDLRGSISVYNTNEGACFETEISLLEA